MIGRIIDVNTDTLLLFVSVICIVPIIAMFIQVYLGSKATKMLQRINYKKLSMATIIFVTGLVYLMTGWVGLLVCIVATIIGLVPILAGVSRTHTMGVLLVPTILYYLGM